MNNSTFRLRTRSNARITQYERVKAERDAELNRLFCEAMRQELEDRKTFGHALQEELGKDYFITVSTDWITVKKAGFSGEYVYQKVREIASINVVRNTINFRKDGAPMVTKSVKYSRDLTSAKIKKEIAKWG